MDRMMTVSGGIARIAGAAALLLPLVPAPAAAQNTPVFTLPTARPTGNPRAAGPVDDENPVVRSAAPSPAPTPAPAPATPAASSAPRPVATATRSATPAVQPARGNASPSASRTAPVPSTAAAPDAALVPQSQPSPTPQVAAPLPQPTTAATDSFALPQVVDSTATSTPGGYWPWIAAAAGILAALFGLLWWRRRPRQTVPEFEAPVVSRPAPAPAVQPQQPAAPQPERAASVPPPQPAAAGSNLAMTLEAQRMTASLMATTLSYTLRLTNQTAQPLSALAVEGDMVSAHASLPPERQIAGSQQRLEPRHALITLAPGESAEFTGDFRLPLTAITPIRAGDAAYFVPLARLRVEAVVPSGAQLVEVQTFVVGELPENPGAALRPFRLDLGPRTYSRLGQRAVS